jgi:hypothetical protein
VISYAVRRGKVIFYWADKNIQNYLETNSEALVSPSGSIMLDRMVVRVQIQTEPDRHVPTPAKGGQIDVVNPPSILQVILLRKTVTGEWKAVP